MADYHDERWPEISHAITVTRAGNPEEGCQFLEDYIERQNGKLGWGLYHATFLLEILQQPESVANSDSRSTAESLFHRLVPEHITKKELSQRLKDESEHFLSLYVSHLKRSLPTNCVYLVALTTAEGRAFKDDLRAFSCEEFLEFVWLEDGYTKWVDLSFYKAEAGTTYITARVGGRVETFRDVYHHDQGQAPFRTR